MFCHDITPSNKISIYKLTIELNSLGKSSINQKNNMLVCLKTNVFKCILPALTYGAEIRAMIKRTVERCQTVLINSVGCLTGRYRKRIPLFGN